MNVGEALGAGALAADAGTHLVYVFKACFVSGLNGIRLGAIDPQAARALEVDAFSLAAMFALAAICLLAGVLPGAVIDQLETKQTEDVGRQRVAEIDPRLSAANAATLYTQARVSAWRDGHQ